MKDYSQNYDLIPTDRKTQLEELAQLIEQQVSKHEATSLIFICTHNSRRSQLCELWMRYALHKMSIDNIKTYSAGTEITAFNHRMVVALTRAGFTADVVKEGDNPRYEMKAGDMSTPLMFSKTYDDDYNPQSDYIAVMVCDHAAEACPIIPGVAHRFPLTYIDPKAHDDTPNESAAYDATVNEIGREMHYLATSISNLLKNA